MGRPSSNSSAAKPGLHPRNAHRHGYDFPALIAAQPRLAAFVRPSPAGTATIDFDDPAAVLALNQALLAHHYGVKHWDLPEGFLCPPIPGRADYLHQLADLLAEGNSAGPPHGPAVCVLDIGTGANCIYPLLGVRSYDWSFVGSDIDATALAWARQIVAANPGLRDRIELRAQRSPLAIFGGVTQPGETFAASLCNPPFHTSRVAAAAGTQRKLRNLHGRAAPELTRNFGGQQHELWCAGGEVAFVQRMIAESATRPELCRWFTTLVSKSESLPPIQRALRAAAPAEVRIIDLAQGQKRSRIVAWRFATREKARGPR